MLLSKYLAPVNYVWLFKPMTGVKRGWTGANQRRHSDRESWIFYDGKTESWPNRYDWERFLRRDLRVWHAYGPSARSLSWKGRGFP